MSNIFSKFKPLLACVAVGILTGLISKYNFQSTNAITIVSGLMAFCITTVVYIYFKQTFILNRLENLHQGIMFYEKQINKRLLGLTNNMPSKNDFDHLEQDVQTMRVKSSFSNSAQSLTTSKTYANEVQTSEDNKVVELHPQKNEKPTSVKQISQLNLNNTAAVENTLVEGIKIQLQPSVSLETKEIYSFNVVPCLTDDNDGLLDSTELKSIFTEGNYQRIISQIALEQTIDLVRKLRRAKKSPLVFVELLACTLNDSKAFDEYIGVLQAHHQVKKNVIIEIPQFDFLTLTKAGLAKLRLILNLGYSMSLSNCSDTDAAISSIAKGLFNHIKLTIDTIEELSITQKKLNELEIVTLCRDAKINIIVTDVEKDYQIIQLIDNHLEIAEGNFFSKPKFPSQDTGAKAAVVKK